jgi:predicted DNA-binding antitoxin AbrB/MazE fold protein
MVIAVEGIWKHGKIIPLEDIDLEENTKVTISIPEPKKKKSILDLAGVWKDDDETYETFKNIYKERAKFRLRK